MALPVFNNSEGGTNNSNVVTSDVASGAPWDTVGTGGTSTCKWTNAQSAHGGLSIALVMDASGSQSIVEWSSATIGTQTELWGRMYFRFAVTPTAVSNLVITRNGSTNALTLNLTTGKHIQHKIGSGSSTTSGGTLVVNTWYRLEWHVKYNGGAGADAADWWVFAGDSTTATDSATGLTGTLGVTSVNDLRFGNNGSGMTSQTMWIDDFGASATGALGPFGVVNTDADTALITFDQSGSTESKSTAVDADTASITFDESGSVESAVRGDSGTAALAVTPSGVDFIEHLDSGTAQVTVSTPPSTIPATTGKANNADGGTNGVIPTVGNTGGASGDAFSVFNSSTNLSFDNTHAHSGNLSYNVTLPITGASPYVSYTGLGATLGADSWARMYLYIPSSLSQGIRLLTFHDSAAALGGVIRLSNTQQIIMANAANTTLDTCPGIPTGQWIRIEVRYRSGATLGELEMRIWWTNPDSTGTPDFSSNKTAQVMGANALDAVRFGCTSAITQTVLNNIWMDDLNANATAWPGPSISTGESQQGNEAGTSTITLTAGGSETHFIPDTGTGLVSMTPGGTELKTTGLADAGTANLTTIPGGLEQFPFSDSATSQIAMTPSLSDYTEKLDVDTATVSITPIATFEARIPVDNGKATISFTQPGRIERLQAVDNQTAQIKITPIVVNEIGAVHIDVYLVATVVGKRWSAKPSDNWTATKTSVRWSATASKRWSTNSGRTPLFMRTNG